MMRRPDEHENEHCRSQHLRARGLGDKVGHARCLEIQERRISDSKDFDPSATVEIKAAIREAGVSEHREGARDVRMDSWRGQSLVGQWRWLRHQGLIETVTLLLFVPKAMSASSVKMRPSSVT